MANYIGGSPPLAFHGSYPSEVRAGLRVYVAAPDYLLAMKLRALRPGTRDEADAATLARACGLTDVDDLLALLQRFSLGSQSMPDAVLSSVFSQRA